MRRLALYVVLVLCLLPGCHRTMHTDVSPAEADRALQTALEAWKGGKSQEDLQKGQPSIIMNEDDWRTGKRLLDFKMEGGALSGRQVRCRVHIKLQDKDDKMTEKDATYIIDTIPRIVIVRDTFAS